MSLKPRHDHFVEEILLDQISLAVKLCQPASTDEYNTRKIGHLVFWVYIYILGRFPVQKYKLEILCIKILTALRARKNAPNLLQFFYISPCLDQVCPTRPGPAVGSIGRNKKGCNKATDGQTGQNII